MAKIGTFVTDPKAGGYCRITLDSGQKIIVNHAEGGFKGGPLTIEEVKWLGSGRARCCSSATWTAPTERTCFLD